MSQSIFKEGSNIYAVGKSKEHFTFALPLEDIITIDGQQYPVEINENDELGTYIEFKGKKYPAEIVSQKNNQFEILFNGITFNFTIETPTSMNRRIILSQQQGNSDIEKIIAPMPGKIVDILVDLNAEVQRGESLIILEAMKMQNELQSPVAGKIIGIEIKVNDNVGKDEVLIEIKKS